MIKKQQTSKEDSFHLGVKALIQNNEGKILVLKANLKTYTGKVPAHWDLPGGRIQKGETLLQALNRETKEEIGIKVRPIKVFDVSISKMRMSYVDAGLILFTYLCSSKNLEKIRIIDEEHLEYKWVSPKEAAKLLNIKFADSFIETLKSL